MRIQLRRKRGFRIPAGTVSVARPSKWGNPFRIGPEMTRESAINLFREWLSAPEQQGLVAQARIELAGKNLACWCPLDKPCHAEVWFEVMGDQ